MRCSAQGDETTASMYRIAYIYARTLDTQLIGRHLSPCRVRACDVLKTLMWGVVSNYVRCGARLIWICGKVIETTTTTPRAHPKATPTIAQCGAERVCGCAPRASATTSTETAFAHIVCSHRMQIFANPNHIFPTSTMQLSLMFARFMCVRRDFVFPSCALFPAQSAVWIRAACECFFCLC